MYDSYGTLICCEICGKGFNFKGQLTQHKPDHKKNLDHFSA